MGQYHRIVNTTKKEFLHPHKMGAGLKFLEWTFSENYMTAFALLLSADNGKGLGDHKAHVGGGTIAGSWAGDNIVIAGDYGEENVEVPVERRREGIEERWPSLKDDQTMFSLFSACDVDSEYTDVSVLALRMLCEDPDTEKGLREVMTKSEIYYAARPDGYVNPMLPALRLVFANLHNDEIRELQQ